MSDITYLLGGVSSIALTITAHEQNQENSVWYIHMMGDFLASKESPFENLQLTTR